MSRDYPKDANSLNQLEVRYLTNKISRRTFVALAAAMGIAGPTLSALADQLDDIRSNQDARRKNLQAGYDYIVCGTGSAGSALVGRLAANKLANILVLEAGDWDTAPSVLDPKVWFTNLGTERDWGVVAEPSPTVNGRAIPEHMGRVVGGGSSINATIWARPFKTDLDHWAELTGDPAWGYKHALDVFRKVENWQGPADARYRGKDGPVWCQPSASPPLIAPALLEAAKELNFPVLPDQNGAREEAAGGFAYMNQIIRDGQRRSMARAYLYDVLGQENVTLLTKALVHRVILEGGRATGVEVDLGDRVTTISATKEVILCAGGMNSAKILMLSGVGEEASLKALGIKTLVDSPEVGANFQDHILHGGCLWEAPEPFQMQNSGANVAGFWKSQSSFASPDINIVQIELPYASDVVAKEYTPPPTSWALCAGLVAPKSRGLLRLRSTNPADKPILHAKFLSHPDDLAALAAGIEVCRELGNSKAMKPFAKREVAPGKKLDKAEMADFVRKGATTYFHEAGTCRMGNDSGAVVDAKLRVNGVRGLRVADASIMPKIVSVATMATCVLIGERMAEILTQNS
ncbi:GMC family oxidoreductase [Bradyrhizobium sp. JYMT SZCCT0428]|uniref:GMC family oxidoreductase n=1 Tax=Bradyrhizobium sp. JYMT SZCCT0428 TaxID=2807673 RepID=UPI001BA69EBC|nr:GMC family oxidoreductase N-terminal domain-containing protein [Bradyrhizobium sp. JYMT SZCCT0428]MBR1149473.1 GMC family oxidoreductase N-terminal domain-containing protein [Bradyrhizobium sp. JYMT SZCCT0428]